MFFGKFTQLDKDVVWLSEFVSSCLSDVVEFQAMPDC